MYDILKNNKMHKLKTLIEIIILIINNKQEKKSSYNLLEFYKYLQYYKCQTNFKLFLLFTLITLFSFNTNIVLSQTNTPFLHYIISFPQPENHTYNLELYISEWEQDSIRLKMPRWTPGYYQIMDYANDIENFLAKDENGNPLPAEKINNNSWSISGVKNKTFVVTYTIRTHRQFVANSYVDKDHAYLVPANTFLYVDSLLQIPVSVLLKLNPEWNKIATGLDPIFEKSNEFLASDFDILYDCPILIGNLEELPSFNVKDIEHRFIGYKLGNFDRTLFMENLKKIVQASIEIIGDIPYKQYVFIAIGPGAGGIEHLNNTTVSFDGNQLNSENTTNRMMSFLAHEYFHLYNVKCIRPFELGPFDYDKENRTNLLWISEGLTVYYEPLILKRANLINSETILSHFNKNLNALENDSGRFYQPLSQASYNTWEEGPFGTKKTGSDKSISVYNKGAIVGMILDFEIRNATNNNKSLDDVIRMLYWKYYKKENRGFTDAEFQQTCEQIAGISLKNLFEYVYTTKEIDYKKYLSPAGLKIEIQSVDIKSKTQKLTINRLTKLNSLQSAILNSLLGQ